MPKKTKTRKQKIKAEQKKTTSDAKISVEQVRKSAPPVSGTEEHSPSSSYTLPTPEVVKLIHHAAKPQTKNIITKGYDSLTKDIRKTTIVTGTIVLAQLLVYFIK